MKNYKKQGSFVFLSFIAGGIVYLLYCAMQRFGFGWFDVQVGWITWLVVIAVLFILR